MREWPSGDNATFLISYPHVRKQNSFALHGACACVCFPRITCCWPAVVRLVAPDDDKVTVHCSVPGSDISCNTQPDRWVTPDAYSKTTKTFRVRKLILEFTEMYVLTLLCSLGNEGSNTAAQRGAEQVDLRKLYRHQNPVPNVVSRAVLTHGIRER